MVDKTRTCQKCNQIVPADANFCPFCGIEISSAFTKDYTKYMYTELVVEAKRIEMTITKDEKKIDQFMKKIRDGSLKLNSLSKSSGLGRTEMIESIKRDMLGYTWVPGGFVHPLLIELEHIKEELTRRDRVDDYQQIEKFIRELQDQS